MYVGKVQVAKSLRRLEKPKSQTRLSGWVARPASVTRQKRLNKLLLQMIVVDLQPFSAARK